MKRNLYLITVMEINGDEIVKKITAQTKNEAVTKAFLSIRADEVECLVLDGQSLRDNYGLLYGDFPEMINDNLPIGATGWYEELLYSRSGERMFVPNNRIYIDIIETQQKPVKIRRGDSMEIVTPFSGGKSYQTGVAWVSFENQHGRGWVMIDEFERGRSYSAYLQEIVQVNKDYTEFNELLGELVYTHLLEEVGE